MRVMMALLMISFSGLAAPGAQPPIPPAVDEAVPAADAPPRAGGAELSQLEERLDRIEASVPEADQSAAQAPIEEGELVEAAQEAPLAEATVDRLEQRLERLERRLSESESEQEANAAEDNSWRYRYHRGTWWYWLPSNRWVYWSNGTWVDYTPATPAPSVVTRSYYPSTAAVRVYQAYPAYSVRSYGSPYYGGGYYGGGYYGGSLLDSAIGLGLSVGSYSLSHAHHHDFHHHGLHHGGHFGGHHGFHHGGHHGGHHHHGH